MSIVAFAMRWAPLHRSAAGARTLDVLSQLLHACDSRGTKPTLTLVAPEADSGNRAAPFVAALKARAPAVICTIQADPNAFWTPQSMLSIWRLYETAERPSIIVYDTPIAEEVWSWQARALWPSKDAAGASDAPMLSSVQAVCARVPQATSTKPQQRVLHVLDAQDVHGWRDTRLQAVLAHMRSYVDSAPSDAQALRAIMSPPSATSTNRFDLNPTLMDHVACCPPSHASPVWRREVAAMQRCDVVLVISSAEMRMLQVWAARHAPLLVHRLVYWPLHMMPVDRDDAPLPAQRKHFVSLGTFRHAPNCDSVHVLHRLWPRIRASIVAQCAGHADVECHVYGTHANHAWMQASDATQGFFIRGDMAALTQLHAYRVLLAPLRFGAGVKGKVVDACAHGVRVVTTHIGAEGLAVSSASGVHVANDDDAFVRAAVQAYTCSESATVPLKQSPCDNHVLTHQELLGMLRTAEAWARPWHWQDDLAWVAMQEGVHALIWKSRYLHEKRLVQRGNGTRDGTLND